MIVHAHRDGAIPTPEKGCFLVRTNKDLGGNGPFSWSPDEAIRRAKQAAEAAGLKCVVVKPKL